MMNIDLCNVLYILENAIIIIDEAHNIEKTAEEGFSLNLDIL